MARKASDVDEAMLTISSDDLPSQLNSFLEMDKIYKFPPKHASPFLAFADFSVKQEYRLFVSKLEGEYVGICFLMIIALVSEWFRLGSLENLPASQTYFLSGTFFTWLGVSLSYAIVNLNSLDTLTFFATGTQRDKVVGFVSKSSPYIGEALLIAASVHIAACLFFSVSSNPDAGRCASSSGSKACNISLPYDQVLLNFMISVVLQVGLRRVSVYCVLVSWGISFVSFVASARAVDDPLCMYGVAYSLFTLYLIYENEKAKRLIFIHSHRVEIIQDRKNTIIHVNDLQQLENERRTQELRVLELNAEKERDSMNLEVLHLRNLIGNVAHDLKTPLQSIAMDLEMLRCEVDYENKLTRNGLLKMSSEERMKSSKSVTSLASLVDDSTSTAAAAAGGAVVRANDNSPPVYTAAGTSSTSSFSSSCSSTSSASSSAAVAAAAAAVFRPSVDMIQILGSLTATCNFMTMAINRCLDFAKATSGIPLVPSPTSFPLKEVIDTPVLIIRQFQSAIRIHVKPIPNNICSHVVSDKHWLAENILCLLSNAVKFSVDGTVTISVQLLGEELALKKQTDSDNEPEELDEKELENVPSNVPGIVPGNIPGNVPGGIPQSTLAIPCIRRGSMSFLTTIVEEIESQADLSSPVTSSCGGSSAPSVDHNTEDENTCDHHEEGGQDSEVTMTVLPQKEEKLQQQQQAAEEETLSKSSNNNKSNNNDNKTAEIASQAIDLSLLDSLLKTPMIKICVEDTGEGLSPENREALFTPLKQGVRTTGGTGLGLYSLAKRIEALGGYYGVNDRADGGSGCMFWFTVPYEPDYDSEEIAAISSSISVPTSSDQQQQQQQQVGTQKLSVEEISSSSSAEATASVATMTSDAKSTTAVVTTCTAPTATAPIATAAAAAAASRVVVGGPAASVMTVQQLAALTTARAGTGTAPSSPTKGATPALPYRAATTSTTPTGGPSTATTTALASSLAAALHGDQKLRILIVDDSLPILKVTERLLTSKGYQVETAKNGSLALDMLVAGYADKKFDLVLMDLQMPVMDGFEATRRYREYELTHQQAMLTHVYYQEKAFASSVMMSHTPSIEPEGPRSRGTRLAAGTDDQSFASSVLTSLCTTPSLSPKTASRKSLARASERLQLTMGLANLERNKRLPIIGMSANSDDASKDMALSVGMDTFIGKPFTWVDLQPLILKFSPMLSRRVSPANSSSSGNTKTASSRRDSAHTVSRAAVDKLVDIHMANESHRSCGGGGAGGVPDSTSSSGYTSAATSLFSSTYTSSQPSLLNSVFPSVAPSHTVSELPSMVPSMAGSMAGSRVQSCLPSAAPSVFASALNSRVASALNTAPGSEVASAAPSGPASAMPSATTSALHSVDASAAASANVSHTPSAAASVGASAATSAGASASTSAAPSGTGTANASRSSSPPQGGSALGEKHAPKLGGSSVNSGDLLAALSKQPTVRFAEDTAGGEVRPPGTLPNL